MTKADLDEMIAGYIEAALFTADEGIIEPKSGQFDATPHLSRVSEQMRAHAGETCRAFLDANTDDLWNYPPREAGHDLWYTRNGHGCGFWECDYVDEPYATRLTDAANALGEVNLFVGDNGPTDGLFIIE